VTKRKQKNEIQIGPIEHFAFYSCPVYPPLSPFPFIEGHHFSQLYLKCFNINCISLINAINSGFFLFQGLFSIHKSWVFYPNSFLLYKWIHGSNCTLDYWFQSLVFQELQLFAIRNSMQLISNTRMMTLQMGFQVMIAMNVPSMMH